MTRLFTPSTLFYGTGGADDLPWAKIEAACGLTFDESQRANIAEYKRLIAHETASFRDAYTFSEIDALRAELLDHCRAIERIVGAARRPDGFMKSRFDALTSYLGPGSRQNIDNLKRAARMAGFTLKTPKPLGARARDVRSERAHVLRLAICLADRKTGVGDETLATTWKLSTSPRSGPFRRFLSALLGIDEPTEVEMRTIAKRLGKAPVKRGTDSL